MSSTTIAAHIGRDGGHFGVIVVRHNPLEYLTRSAPIEQFAGRQRLDDDQLLAAADAELAALGYQRIQPWRQTGTRRWNARVEVQ